MTDKEMFGCARSRERENMSESKHTPGPWKITDHRKDEECLYIESERDRIASIFTGTLTPEDEIDANARLISVAPDLIFLVRWMVDHPGECLGDHGNIERQAIQILAKAEGHE